MGLNIDYGYDFERFWKSYPRKVNKGQAYKAFQKLKLSTKDVDELVMHLERRKKDDAKWVEGKFIPHAASFLNGHRWLDDYEKVKRHWSDVSRGTDQSSELAAVRRLGYATLEDYYAGRRMH